MLTIEKITELSSDLSEDVKKELRKTLLLHDKVVIVTGGAQGIGEAISRLFASLGAKVVIGDMKKESGEKVAENIRENGGEAIFVTLNVTDRESVQEALKATLEKYGRINALINNAGITQDAFLTKMTEDQWDRVINVNLKGVFNMSQAVAVVMMQQGEGVIINISSVVGVFGNIAQTNYAASKAGVIGMMLDWMKELGKKGVRTNVVAPGFTETSMTKDLPDKVKDMVFGRTPLGRMAKPQEIAWGCAYLVSDEAAYVNGAVLNIDGGFRP